MELLSLTVAAGNPEHTSTVSSGTGHSSNTNSDRCGISLGTAGRTIGVNDATT